MYQAQRLSPPSGLVEITTFSFGKDKLKGEDIRLEKYSYICGAPIK